MALPPSRTPRQRPLTASALRVTSGGGASESMTRLGLPWQERSLRYYDEVGELRYAAQFYARMLKQLRIFPTLREPGREHGEEIKDGPPVELLDRIQDPGGGRSQMQWNYGRLMFITGEGYLLGRRLNTEEERWDFVWKEGLRIERGGKIRYKSSPDAKEEEYGPNEAVAYKMWTPHPQWPGLADSPMRAVLDIAEELLILTRSVRSTAVSRLIRSGILLIPQEIEPPPQEPVGDEDPLNSPLLRDLVEHVTGAVENPGTAEATVPFILFGGSEWIDKVKRVDMHNPDTDYLERDLREEAIKRLALSLDMPPEILLGMADSNHWTAWQISDEVWRWHGAPIAEHFCDDLSEVYLQPALRELGYPDWRNVCVHYDATEILVNVNRSEDADEAWDRGAIGYEAYRRAKNFTERDAQTPEEHEEWILVKGRPRERRRLTPDAPRESIVGEEPPAGPDPVRERNGVAASARILGAAEMALLDCRKKAGARARTLKAKCPDCLAEVNGKPNSQVVALLGTEGLKRLGAPDPLDLVAGGADDFKALLAAWGIDAREAASLAGMVESYAARTLLEVNPPAVPSTLAAHVQTLERRVA